MTARLLRGVLLTREGRSDAAIDEFLSITTDRPDLPEPYNNLAVLFAAQGRYDDAPGVLRRAIELQPDYDVAHENLGDVYLKLAALAHARAQQFNAGSERVAIKAAAAEQIVSASQQRSRDRATVARLKSSPSDVAGANSATARQPANTATEAQQAPLPQAPCLRRRQARQTSRQQHQARHLRLCQSVPRRHHHCQTASCCAACRCPSSSLLHAHKVSSVSSPAVALMHRSASRQCARHPNWDTGYWHRRSVELRAPAQIKYATTRVPKRHASKARGWSNTLEVFDRHGWRECQTIVGNNRGRLTSNTAGVDAAAPECIVYFDRSPKQAREMLAQLRAKGLADLMIIARGKDATGISLGVYSKCSGAERRQRDLARQGVTTQIAEYNRSMQVDSAAVQARGPFIAADFSARFADIIFDINDCRRLGPSP